MTTQSVTPNGAWTDFQGVRCDGTAANTATTDLISILDTVEVPIVVLRRDFMLVWFNKPAADVLRFSPSDIGRASRDISVLAGFPRLEEQCSEVIASGVESRADFRDGDKWFVMRISPYTQGDRQVTGTVLTFTNVTAFRASIDQVVYERECTKAILDTVADPLVVLSADQRIQSGNRAFYTMFLELASLLTQLKEMLAGSHAFQPVEVDHVFPGEGQRRLILDARPLSLPGHSERRVLVTFQDITARKQAETANDLRAIAERKEELRRSEAFLAEAQRLSLTGSFSWRVTTDEIKWSQQLYRIYEFDQGMPVTLELIRTRVHPEDLTLYEKMVEEARNGGHDFEWQYRLLMPDHSIKFLHAVAHATRDQDGQLEYIASIQDVTGRRLSEEARDRARSELAKVAGLMSLGTLAASIAHEINQPLSGIVTNASICQRMLAAAPPNIDGALETARRTIRDANRASEVIARLRALFSRKDTATESVDLNEATREVMALSLSGLQRNQVVVRAELAEDLPSVTGDRVQLQQVILNLLRNASDAMSTVDDRPRELLIRTERDEDDRVRVSVKDMGVGFQPQAADRLFEAFYTTKNDGMGIGLSVSRSIIEAHRGRLWAKANDGPGATFSFSIPCRSAGITGDSHRSVQMPCVTDAA
ncbi:MAG TPA: ATP-binding protein [Candidatus Acidoferrum sp.]|jgi:C4-dicarboxylate-specific signal transduction histidine kinase|nr:ATP-binding protein [Candidatus Acidoferrum sp.]